MKSIRKSMWGMYWKLHDKRKRLAASLKGYLDGLPPETRRRIVLGQSAPLSGPAAQLGLQMQAGAKLFFDGVNAALMANNYDWFSGMNCLEFMRDIGKHFSVNAMIKKESVQQRLVREDQGISYTEFSYSLLQGYDFAELYKRHGCVLQVGGSDQWGNIVAGTDLTRRLHQQHVFGLTLPLITKADGTKFGKTESGAVWLDPKKTSPYAFYQFWLNTADADVYKFLKFFTFLPLARINEIEATDRASGSKPDRKSVV